MRWYLVLPLACAFTAPLAAQDSTAKRPDSVVVDTLPPTPAQERWLAGLRVAARGVGQIRTGIDRVQRANTTSDTARLKSAGRMLGGVCGTARGFMRSGRQKMSATAYEGARQVATRAVTSQIDSLMIHAAACEHATAQALPHTLQDMIEALRRYEAAIADLRVAMGIVKKPAPVPEPPTSH